MTKSFAGVHPDDSPSSIRLIGSYRHIRTTWNYDRLLTCTAAGNLALWALGPGEEGLAAWQISSRPPALLVTVRSVSLFPVTVRSSQVPSPSRASPDPRLEARKHSFGGPMIPSLKEDSPTKCENPPPEMMYHVESPFASLLQTFCCGHFQSFSSISPPSGIFWQGEEQPKPSERPRLARSRSWLKKAAEKHHPGWTGLILM